MADYAKHATLAHPLRAIGIRGMTDFGRELTRLMQVRGVGVRELARAAYCNPGHVSNLRSGKSRPSPQLAEALDRHLGAGGTLAAIAARSGTGSQRGARRLSRAVEALQVAMSGSGDGIDVAEDGLAELVAHYAHAVAVAPSEAVYDELVSTRSFAGTLLARGGRAQRPDLAVTAGWLSSLLAISATDLGDHAAAVVWCADTERRGGDAGHRPVPRTWRTTAPGTSTRARGWRFPQPPAAKGTTVDDGELTAEQIATLTASMDIDAPPPGTQPSALVLFGTNQTSPARIAADRYHRGLAPLIIATGGINRHDGIVEGREFARQLAAADVPANAVRIEDQSKDTWQNVELSLPYLREALAVGLPLVVVSKWYHLRAVYCLRTQLPEAVPLYAIGWDPVYAGTLVTRDNWPTSPDGRRRVIRESREVPQRVADGSYLQAVKKDGAWS